MPVNTPAQQGTHGLHRIREHHKAQRTAAINRVRGLLREFGVVIPAEADKVQAAVLAALEEADNPLPFDLRRALAGVLDQIGQAIPVSPHHPHRSAVAPPFNLMQAYRSPSRADSIMTRARPTAKPNTRVQPHPPWQGGSKRVCRKEQKAESSHRKGLMEESIHELLDFSTLEPLFYEPHLRGDVTGSVTMSLTFLVGEDQADKTN